MAEGLYKELKKRLLPTRFLIDVNQPKYSDASESVLTILLIEITHLVQMLIRPRKQNSLLLNLAEESIKHSITYGFTSISCRP
jgi:hypothetical protein